MKKRMEDTQGERQRGKRILYIQLRKKRTGRKTKEEQQKKGKVERSLTKK